MDTFYAVSFSYKFIFCSLVRLYFSWREINVKDGIALRLKLHVTLRTIWYHLYNLKHAKGTRGGVLFFLRFQPATLLKVALLHGCFSRFLNCSNGTKSCKASRITGKVSFLFFKSFLLVLTKLSFSQGD